MQTVFILSGIVAVIIGLFVYIFVFDEYKKKKKSARHTHDNLPASRGVDITYVEQGVGGLGFVDEQLKSIKTTIHQQIIGMDEFINTIFVTMLSEGNMLIEGVPGLAKTKTIHTLADILGMQFSRVQFTPDMLPSDIVGVDIFNPQTREFETKIGPIVANIVLADEINRTTPKVQSALLEAMQEKQFTIGGKTYKLPKPFFVLATQNPIEQAGTYPLPEAQIDRFLCKVIVDYPTQQEEKNILTAIEHPSTHVHTPLSIEDFLTMKKQVNSVEVSDIIKDYITRLVQKTRDKNPLVVYGASPRGSISLMQAGRAVAYLVGRDYVTHEDIQRVALPVLRHRLLLSYEAKIQEVTADMIVKDVVRGVGL